MRNLYVALAACVVLVPAINAHAATWADIHRVVGLSDSTPEFQSFAAHYNLSRRAILADAGLRPPQFCYVNDSGMRVFFGLDSRVKMIVLTPKAVFDPKADFPSFGSAAPARDTILTSLGVSGAPEKVHDDGTERYTNKGQGVYVEFLGGQLRYICFYSLPENLPP